MKKGGKAKVGFCHVPQFSPSYFHTFGCGLPILQILIKFLGFLVQGLGFAVCGLGFRVFKILVNYFNKHLNKSYK